jgi:murein hydrolase activator
LLLRPLGLLLAATLLVVSHPAPAKNKEDLKELHGRIEALQKELAASEESRDEAEDALRESERAISDANRKLAELTARQHAADAVLSGLNAEGRRIRAELDAQQVVLSRLLYQQYLGGRQDYLRLLLSGEDPDQIARDLHYLGQISRERATWLKELRNNLDQLQDNTRRSQEESAELDRIRALQAEQKRRLQLENAERKKVLAGISRQVEHQRREIGKLQRDERRLTRLVERLAKIVAATPELAGSAANRNTRIPDATFEGKTFAELKGSLSLPVKGELANRFGSPRVEGGTVWKGLFIRSAEGESVRAIAPGRVVFADWLRGFGNLLILDHGQGYMSLYGNNETLFKDVGEPVKGGDVLAAVGNSGGNQESGVYFEIRYQGKPMDPVDWVRLR